MKKYNISEFRSNAYSIMEEVTTYDEPIELINARNPKEAVVIISKKDYDRIEETIYLMSNNIHKVVNEREKDEFVDYDEAIWDTL